MVLQRFFDQSPLTLLAVLAVLLTCIEWCMVWIGRKYRLGPAVSPRSMHRQFTPTGGGIVWVVAALIGIVILWNWAQTGTWIFFFGIIFLAIISYIDDIHPLPPVPRLISQIIVMTLTFKQLFYPQAIDIYLIVIFCGVGIINAINFLDGICGMLALYGIVITGSLIYALSLHSTPSTEYFLPLLIIVLIGQAIFAVFNLRDTVFAGDLGSITLGYILVSATITLILATRDGSYIVFFSVCIFDTGLTTLHRLFSGYSILQPHRTNIYQLLTIQYKLPQVVVSIIYALLQMLINALFFLIPPTQHWTYFLLIATLLTITYFFVRFSFPNNKSNHIL